MSNAATVKQIAYIKSLAAAQNVAIDTERLSKPEASQLIDRLKYGRTFSYDLPVWVDDVCDYPAAGIFG